MNITKYTLVLLFVSGLAWGQARFEVVGGLEHDYGRVPLTDLRDTLTIMNPGTAPLHILGINPTCGCTAAIIDTNTIPPGGKAHVYVKIEPPDVPGKIHKTIVFLTNDLMRPSREVGFGFEIERDLEMTPRHFAFSNCRVHTPCLCTILMTNRTDKPMSIYRQPMTMPGLRSLVPDTLTIAPHDTASYRLQWTPDTTGFQTGRFSVKTTSTRTPVMEFNVVSNVADEHGIVPIRIH